MGRCFEILRFVQEDKKHTIMKKNYLFGLFAMATMLFTASCQEEDIAGINAGNSDVVTFAVNMKQTAATRAEAALAGRGKQANKLYYGVYEATEVDADGNGTAWQLVSAISAAQEEGQKDPADISSGNVNVEIKLAKQKLYSVIFWATNENNDVCNVDWVNRTMTMTNDGTANNEANDAFWAYETVKLNGAVAKTVDLYRPFAQLNIGASEQDIQDAAAANVVVSTSQIVLKKVANTFNMETGAASGETTLTYDYKAIPNSADWDFPVDEHQYLALGYVLVGTNKSLVDVELSYKDTKGGNYSSTFTSVPVQRNYRTNIYGNLLSNSADYNVNLKPELGDGENVEVKDVTTTEEFLAAINDPTIDHVVMTGDIDLAQLTTRASATIAEPVLINRDLTIDGKGFKVKTNGTRAFRITKSDVNVVFDNVNVVSRAVMQYPNDIRGISIDPALNNVKLTLNNSSVDFTDATACDWAYAVNVAGDGTGHTVTVNGGSYEGANVINIHGSNNTIVIKDTSW